MNQRPCAVSISNSFDRKSGQNLCLRASLHFSRPRLAHRFTIDPIHWSGRVHLEMKISLDFGSPWPHPFPGRFRLSVIAKVFCSNRLSSSSPIEPAHVPPSGKPFKASSHTAPSGTRTFASHSLITTITDLSLLSRWKKVLSDNQSADSGRFRTDLRGPPHIVSGAAGRHRSVHNQPTRGTFVVNALFGRSALKCSRTMDLGASTPVWCRDPMSRCPVNRN
jgi:hypothetical protein